MARSSVRLVLSGLVISGLVLTGTGVIPAAAGPTVTRSAARIDDVASGKVAPPPVVQPDRPRGVQGVTVTRPAAVSFPAPQPRSAIVLSAGSSVRVGTAPVAVGPLFTARGTAVAGQLSAQVLAHADAVTAVGPSAATGVRLTPSAALAASGARTARVTVGYAGFEQAFGGGYLDRLRLFRVPDCHVTRPNDPACNPVVLPTEKNFGTKTLSADVPVTAAAPGAGGVAAAAVVRPQAVTLVAAAAASGSGGDYTATPLQHSSNWQVGLGSGGLNYSYPLPELPSVGGPTPGMSLTYDSGQVDGRTSDSNGQVSWIGQGWDLEPGFVERRYRPCSLDGHPMSGDKCWGGSQYVISVNGQSHDLIPVPRTGTSEFRMRDDSGWKIELRSGLQAGGQGQPNGDDDGEWLIATSPDGTRYFFGSGKAAWGAGPTFADTNSTWTVPVFGDDPGEPCNKAAGFSSSWCQQAWRWNLDRVVDPHGNIVVYTYLAEPNKYARLGVAADATSYERGGFVTKVEWGDRSGGTAISRLLFNYALRCVQAVANAGVTCPSLAAGTATDYPDTPVDRICSAATCASSLNSPTFFTGVRLTSVESQRWFNGAWSTADTVATKHRFLDPDGTGPDTPELWLDDVHKSSNAATGTGNVQVPPVAFSEVILQNRLDPATGELPLKKPRIDMITDELGMRITAYYGHGDGGACTAAPADPSANVKDCFPRWFTPDSGVGKTGWFHKYLVTRVRQEDTTTGSLERTTPLTGSTIAAEPRITEYAYTGGAAWHHDNDLSTEDSVQSWSQWRGYGLVTVNERTVRDGVLDPAANETVTLHRLFRGMYGDRIANSALTKTTTVDTVEQANIPDAIWLSGKTAEMTRFAGGVAQYREWYDYTNILTANSPEYAGVTTRDAFKVPMTEKRVRITSSAGIRKTKQLYTVVIPTDHLQIETGTMISREDWDSEPATNPRCTTYNITFNEAVWMLRPAREQGWDGTCANAGTAAAPHLSQVDHFYDTDADVVQATPFGPNPNLVKGDERKTITRVSDGPPVTSFATRTNYDAYGRVLSTTDGNGNVTTTSYLADTSGVPISSTVTSPTVGTSAVSLTTTTQVDKIRGLPVLITDPNGQKTGLGYDGLGRLLSGTVSGDTKATFFFRYSTPTNPNSGIANGPTEVQTSRLQLEDDPATATVGDAVYLNSWTYYNGFGDPLQTQAAPPVSAGTSNKILFTGVTLYDDRGNPRDQGGPTLISGLLPGNGWQAFNWTALPSDTRSTWDMLDRPTSSVTEELGAVKWKTLTSWDGPNSTVSPPTGGDIETRLDGYGRTAQIREYDIAATPAVHATTVLTYDGADRLTTVTSPMNIGLASPQRQTYSYDLAGRRTVTDDPDSGHSTATYDNNGNVISTVDARNTRVSTNYDELNRPTIRYTGAVTTSPTAASTLASWTYGTSTTGNTKGRLVSQTARVAGANYVQAIPAYDVQGRPTGSSWTIPAGFGVPAALTYTEGTYTYDKAGHLTSTNRPGIGGLGAETVTAGYDNRGYPTTLTSTAGGTLVADTTFDGLARLLQRRFDNVTNGPLRRYTYDNLNRVANIITETTAAGVTTTNQQDTYGYTGPDLTSVTDNAPGTNNGQKECFGYDFLRRLTRAYTTTNAACGAATTGGVLPYNQTWTFDKDNSIKTFADTVAGLSSAYTIGGTGAPAHASTAVTGSGAATRAYDASGYLKTSTLGAQTLTWDAQHQLVTDVKGGVTTTYVYGADGSRLIRQAGAETTLTLGGTDIVYNATGTKARRYYTLGGAQVAMRDNTSGTLKKIWLAGNTQGSTSVSIDSSNNAVTRTRYTPYGQPRTAAVGPLGTGLPTDHGWLGKTLDKAAGLNHLDARYYDSGLFNFVAPDPLVQPTNPRSTNPYTYSYGNPVGFVDPSGLRGTNCRKTCSSNPCGSCSSGGGSSGDSGSSGGGGSGSQGGGSSPGGKKRIALHVCDPSNPSTCANPPVCDFVSLAGGNCGTARARLNPAVFGFGPCAVAFGPGLVAECVTSSVNATSSGQEGESGDGEINPPSSDKDSLLRLVLELIRKVAEGAGRSAANAGSKLPDLVIDDAQFGAKVGKHAQDFALDPADPAARDFVRSRIIDIHANPSEVRQGPWNPKGGGGSDYLFYRQGQDVVVTRGTGDFVTILKGGESNGWFQGARVVGQ